MSFIEDVARGRRPTEFADGMTTAAQLIRWLATVEGGRGDEVGAMVRLVVGRPKRSDRQTKGFLGGKNRVLTSLGRVQLRCDTPRQARREIRLVAAASWRLLSRKSGRAAVRVKSPNRSSGRRLLRLARVLRTKKLGQPRRTRLPPKGAITKAKSVWGVLYVSVPYC